MRRLPVALLFSAAASVAFAQSGVEQAGRPSPKDQEAFTQLVAVHAAALNKRDGAAVAATFTTNGTEVVMDGPMLSGRTAIRDEAAKMLATWPATRTFTLTLAGARMFGPNVAELETEATFSEGLPPNRGNMLVVREGGRWLIASLRVYPGLAKP